MVRIWIDADACPGPVRDIVFRAARRVGVPVTLVANRPLQLPRSPLIGAVRVGPGLDEADHYLARAAGADDLVITADIPLAALNPRGDEYTAENIQEQLTLRDLKEELRSAGGGGYHRRAEPLPPPRQTGVRQRPGSLAGAATGGRTRAVAGSTRSR